ncbi:MAG: translation initiation factor IF-2 [Pseudomonadota bacterium]
MSKKEILNRLTRTHGDSARGWSSSSRSGPADGTVTTTTKGEVEKRVSRTVIRRRPKDSDVSPPPVDLDALKPGSPTVVRRRRVVEAPPASEPTGAPAQVESVVESQVPEPATAEAAEPGGESPAAVEHSTTPAESAEAPGASVTAEAQPVEAQPAEAPPASAEPPAAEPPAHAEDVQVETGSAAPEPPATEVAPLEPVASAPVEEAPVVVVTPVVAPPPPTPAVKTPTAAEKTAEQLPRFDGLGKAVVRPPPGYDPNDPLGSRKRAREAAEASVRATRTPTPGPVAPENPPGWAGAGKPSAEDRERTRGRPRRKQKRAGRIEMLMDDMPAEVRRKKRTRRMGGAKKMSPQPKAQKRRVQVDGTISVSQLAKELSVKATDLVRALMGMGKMARINDDLDFETAQLVAAEYEYEVIDASFKEEEHLIQIEEEEEDLNAEPRPPVITIMGHVDHGKTSLLDYIRKAKVAAGEAGGITQHISSYQFEHGGETVTFIDTPGHAAFTEMRARGANATDLVILVVAADDGVMPQTIESINHTRAAGVPIVVAINKCDKKGVKPEVVRHRLVEHGLVPEEFGGETLMVNVSAITGKGVSDLLDAVMLQAEMLELSANPDRHAEGVVLESRLEKGRGPVASVIVQEGTLKHGDCIVVGTTYGRVRALSDFQGKKLKKAGPSTPVEIMGLSDVPAAGDHFMVVESDKDAKALAEHRADAQRQSSMVQREKLTFEELLSRAQGDEIKSLPMVVKADVQGSLEALKGALVKLKVDGVELKVLHSAVGAISESDITLAGTYGSVVIGFNIRPDPKARRAAEQAGVEIRTYKVIYELLDDIRASMVGMLSPIKSEQYLGTAEIRQTFSVPKVGTVAGCYVQDGTIIRNGLARLVREGVEVWEGKLSSLKRFKDDVREVQAGFECGLGLDGFNDIKIGDTVQVFKMVEVAAQG